MATRVDELRNGNGGPSGSYADLDDRMLVLDFQTGNGSREPAFAEIHRRYSGLARHICFRFLADASEAEDATQETMLRVLQGLARFNGRYRLQPWVARIATNVSLDILRARSRRPQSADRSLIDLCGVADDAAEPSVLFERLLERERVQKVLAELPDHHREALVLREYEGRSHEEIGRALGVTPSQAKALIHRAKGSFRRAWDRREERHWGLGALGPLFLAPLRASEWLRRLLGSATEAAAVTSASPAAATTAISVGERVTATAVVVVMAATVGVGAVGLRHRADGRADRQQAAVVAPSPTAPVVAPSPTAPVVVPAVRPERPEPKKVHEPGHAKGGKATDPAPVVEVAPAVSPTPTPSPSPTVSETPTPPPTADVPSPPPPDPPPTWTIGIQAWAPWSLACDCGSSLRLVSSQVNGTTDSRVFFTQTVEGEGVDADGAVAWRLEALYTGVAQGSEGRFSLFLSLETPQGVTEYQGWGLLVASEGTAQGIRSVYSGQYRLVDFRPAEGTDTTVAGLPTGGKLEADVKWWGDGSSLTGVFLTLEER